MERLILNVEDQYVDYLSYPKENIDINRSTEIPPQREWPKNINTRKCLNHLREMEEKIVSVR